MTKLTHPIRYCIQQQKNFYYCLENSMATCQCDHGPGEKKFRNRISIRYSTVVYRLLRICFPFEDRTSTGYILLLLNQKYSIL